MTKIGVEVLKKPAGDRCDVEVKDDTGRGAWPNPDPVTTDWSTRLDSDLKVNLVSRVSFKAGLIEAGGSEAFFNATEDFFVLPR